MPSSLRLLLLPGWAMPAALYGELVGLLGDRFEVTTASYSGALDPAALDARARAALFTHAPHVLLGWSLGSLVALRLAAYEMPGVRCLVSISGFASFVPLEGHPPGVAPRILDRMKRKLARDASTVASDFGRSMLSSSEGSWLPSIVSAFPSALPWPVDELGVGLDYLRTQHALDALTTISVPVVLVHGTDDPITPLASFRWLSAALGPRARAIALSGAGHALPLTAPRAISEAVCGALEV